MISISFVVHRCYQERLNIRAPDIRTDGNENVYKTLSSKPFKTLRKGMLYASSGVGPSFGLPRVRRGGVSTFVGGRVEGTVGSTGGKVHLPAMTCPEAENCGIS